MQPTARTRRAEYALQTREALIAAAGEMFVEQGYAQTSLDQIAGAARVSKGAIYHHFPDKPSLFAEVFAGECGRALGYIAERAGASTTTFEQFVDGVRLVFDVNATNPTLRNLSRQATEAIGEDRRRHIQAGRSLPFVKDRLDQLAAAGHLRPVDTEVAAKMILEAIFNAVVTYAGDPTPANRDAVETVLVALIGGLRAN